MLATDHPGKVRHSSPMSGETGLDPRIARTRAAVLRAATDLLVEGGTNAVTIDAIVTRSGVAKSTIYRHWDTRDDVLLAVIENCAPQIERPSDDLPFEDALRHLMSQLSRTLGDPEWARVLPALAALRNQDHGIAQLEQRIEAKQEDALESVLRRGIAEGRLPEDIDLDRAAAVLIGPLLFATLVEKPEIDDELGEFVVDTFLRTHALV